MSASITAIRPRIAIPVLAAALTVAFLVLLGGALAPRAQAAIGEFQPLASSEVDLTSEAVDPTTNLIYAQENNGTRFFVYDPRTDKWSELPEAPINSGNNGGAVYLNGKIYVSYTHESEELSVYDIAKNEWTKIKNPLERGTAVITAVGDSLYMAEGTKFVKYNPSTETTTELAEVPEYKSGGCEEGFERWGGLHPYNGKLYGHQGDGCDGFWSYDISKNEWTELPKLPEGAVAGGAVDPVTGTYYADGNYDENHMFIYDIAKGEWTTVEMPFVVEDAGMAYVSLPGLTGIYAIQGEEGVEFTRYTTREAEADLALTNSAASATTVGSQFTYTLTVSNGGPNASEGVKLSDPLPANVSYVSSTASQGSCTGSTTVTCALGALAGGASATVTITVKATAVGTAADTAIVSAGTKDPNAANNTASASTVIASTAIASGVPPLNPARWLVHGGKLLVHSGSVSDPLLNLNPTLSLAGPARLVTYGSGGGALLANAVVSLPAGATQRLTLHLTSSALKKVTGRRVKVQLLLTLHDELGRNINATGVYLLVGPARKHAKKHHHKKK